MKPHEKAKIVTTRVAKVWMGEDGIVRAKANSDTRETLEDAKENVAAVNKVTRGKKSPLFIDYRSLKAQDRDAQNHYSTAEATQFVSALGMQVESAVSRVILNFYLGIRKSPQPLKLFNDEDEALQWLKGFLE